MTINPQLISLPFLPVRAQMLPDTQRQEAPRKDHLSFVPHLPVEATPQKPSALEVLITGSPLRAVLSWSDSSHLRISHAHHHFPSLCPFPPSLTPVPSSTYLELMNVRTDHGDSNKELSFFWEKEQEDSDVNHRINCMPPPPSLVYPTKASQYLMSTHRFPL